MTKVSNEKKNLNRLAGEFLVASRLTQRGYMVALQWGTTIGYDILVFDKSGNSAFIEVKSSATYHRRWVLQAKYAKPEGDSIPLARRFVCCVDLSQAGKEPDVYVFPAKVVADGLNHFFGEHFPNSPSLHLSLDFRPQYRSKDVDAQTVGEAIEADTYRDKYSGLPVDPLLK